MQGFQLSDLTPPSVNPTARLKVHTKGLISKYWSIDNNGQELFRVNTTSARVELRHCLSDLFASANLAPPEIFLPSPSSSQCFPPKIDVAQPSLASFRAQLNLEYPISLKRGFLNRLSLGAPNEAPSILLIRDVPGQYKWRSWQIYDERFPSKPIIQFVWFGSNPKEKKPQPSISEEPQEYKFEVVKKL
ncbi:hypothetical protein DSO57_1032708 [Entomophthora muscae]|uniref:Uncharacterized protein n=1 Tax=Entomophthora muscae TaxID=34485 RepID=A0ACC2UA40_9FUNG|nr:hypothetical protein DSO57_1032708 [Entomophthora muscae]